MPTTQTQLRRGSTAAHAGFTGAEGELTIDTTLDRPVTHDGALPGGYPSAMLHLAQTFVQSQTLAAAENFFGSIVADNVAARFLSTPGMGYVTLDFNTNGTPDLNFIRKYATTPFQVEIASSGGIDLVVDSNNNETGSSVRFLTNAIRGGVQTTLATFFDNGTNEFTNRTTVTIPALDGTTTSGYSLVNTTAAAAGVQQVSPALQFEGFGWRLAPPGSASLRWRQFLLPIEGTTTFRGDLLFQFSVAGGGFTDALTLSSTGTHTVTGVLSVTGSIESQTSGVTLAAAGLLSWATRSRVSSPGDGLLRLTDNAQTGFTRLQFGGTTSAFPAIGRNGTGLEIIAADGVGQSSLSIFWPALDGTTNSGLRLVNTTAAAAGAQQVSPALYFEGFGWKTNAVAASQSVRWRQFVNPVQAASEPTAELAFQVSVNAAAFSSILTLRSTNLHTLTGNLSMTGSIGNLSELVLADTALLYWLTRTVISSPSNGVLRLTNNAQTDFTRLQFGGTTSAFPAIGRNGTALEIIGADGAGPSSLQIYNTKTSSTNFERLDIQWTANVAQIWTEKGSGGGTARSLVFGTDATVRLTIGSTGAITWGPGGAVSTLATDGGFDISDGTMGYNVATDIFFVTGMLTVDRGAELLSFFGVAPVIRQSAGNLTNNTTGGTANTISDFAGAVYATDAPTIEGNFNQLATKLNAVIDALRAYGLLN